MTSIGVWKVSNPFIPSLNQPSLENGGYLKVITGSQDVFGIADCGGSVKVQTEGPHLVSLGGGRSSVIIHPLPEGRVFIGCPDSHYAKDIIICGSGIAIDHCFIDNNSGLVSIYPQSGDVRIDGVLVTEPTCLSQGCILCLGNSNFFRFNNPKEALLMKQASPVPRRVQAPTTFIPVDSSPQFNGGRILTPQYLDGIDLVEKVSKFEYMSHSQPPPITSQDTPKYFVKEGIRFLHSAPPLMRIHKNYSSENSIKNTSSVSRVYSPLSSKPGFFTPPPYPSITRSSPKVSMSPKTKRFHSKTPDPVSTNCTSPATVWSGRCTPTSPMSSVCRSHHVSAENLKACEYELHEQHRKAVRERLKDQEQEKQERLRLEEILHLCAEYEEQTQREQLVKTQQTLNSKDPSSSSSSSGEFSVASTDSSAPRSSHSSNNSRDISSKSGSNLEGYLPTNVNPIGATTYITMPVTYLAPNQTAAKVNGSNYCLSSGYHTVPNRIKTNGSLPRDRGNLQLSPTNDAQGFLPQSLESNGAMTFTNHKALNSASSEDELCAILGSNSVSKPSPIVECNTGSPCMGTAAFAYPNSPRTRIKTVVNHQEKSSEVYENKHAVNSLAARENLTLTLPSTPDRHRVGINAPKGSYYSSENYLNSNYQSPNSSIGINVDEEISKLHKDKDGCLQDITSLKHKVSDLDCQKNEILNALQLELALLAGEIKDKEQLQFFEGNKVADLQNRKLNVEQKSEVTQRELEIAKSKVIQQEKLVGDLQNHLCSLHHESLLPSDMNLKLDELKAQSELLDIERKAFEDLEFQQLESQAHEEEAKEDLNNEIECFSETIAQRQMELSELNKQKQSIEVQIDNEKLKCENQLKMYTNQLRQDITNLDMINTKLKALCAIKFGASPCSSPDDNSPHTSESDAEIQRNCLWNTQTHMIRGDGVQHSTHVERSDNCNSFHSFESESSSLTSSDTGGENGQRTEDKIQSDGVLDVNKVHQKELAIKAAFQDQAPLVNHRNDNGNFTVKLRDKPRSQRPLTRYLPIRNSEFDLRHHIESAGHQIELCGHVHVTATSCHGYLHKLGGTWKTWQKRWFVFDRIQKALLYYSDKGESKLRGGVNFQEIEEVYVDHLHSVKSPSPQSIFCVKTYDRVYYLMAPTPETMRIWVDVIFTGAEGYHDFLGEIE